MSALTLISCEDTGIIEKTYHSPYFTSPYTLTWENDILTSNITSTGTIAYLTFLVGEDAEEKDYSIIVGIPTDGILDANGDNVPAESAGGVITVSKQHECSFGDWEPYSKTKHVRYCSDEACDEAEYQKHNWDNGKIVTEATHEDDGEMEYACEDCGAKKTSVITAGHDWGDWTNLSDTQHERVCSCGDSETEAHNWDSGVVTTPPTETEEGVKTYACEVCNASKTESIAPNEVFVAGVVLDKASETLKVGGNVSLVATVAPSNATNKNVIWESSDPEVASVSDNGLVTANKAGTATITARTEDGDFEATCEITVSAPETHVPGDINGDTNVNNKDLSLLFQYLSDWDVEVNEPALDVNGDGYVNNKDLSLLFQYLSDWDVEIH